MHQVASVFDGITRAQDGRGGREANPKAKLAIAVGAIQRTARRGSFAISGELLVFAPRFMVVMCGGIVCVRVVISDGSR